MTDRNFEFSVRLVRALASLGVTHGCVTPGSRSTPLALALALEPAVTDWPHLDERSSSFFALGVAKATGVPAVAVCTSGTAAAEFHPAVVEAHHSRVPLIVITADRPAELRGVGANQTIDQAGLYGTAVKWFHDLEPPRPGEGAAAFPESLAARLVSAARGEPAGPVHLNVRFREPLVPRSREVPAGPHPPALSPGRLLPTAEAVARMSALAAGRRGLLVCGPQSDPALPGAAAAWAAAAGWPVIADPLSGARAGPHELSHIITAGDPLANAGWLDGAAPEVVIRVGGLPTSKPVWRWLEEHPAVPQILIDAAGWRDPMGSLSLMVRADPAAALAALAEAAPGPAPDDWLPRWRRAEETAAAAIDWVLADAPFPNEPAVARLCGEVLPAGSLLVAASSMPVRDVDAFLRSRPAPLRIIGNRGASGIDGLLSTGLGAAAAAGSPTYLLAGDLSAFHDLTALGTAARLGIAATIVVLHNDGGGIFHFLPQAAALPDLFERHWGTPHGLDFVRAAAVFGVEAARVDSRDELAARLAEPPPSPRLFEVRSDRAANLALHRRLQESVHSSLAAL